MQRRKRPELLFVLHLFPIGQGLLVAPRLRQSQGQISLHLRRLADSLRQKRAKNICRGHKMPELHLRHAESEARLPRFRKIRISLPNFIEKLRRVLKPPDPVGRHSPEISHPREIIRHRLLFPVALQKRARRQKGVGRLSSFQRSVSKTKKSRRIEIVKLSPKNKAEPQDTYSASFDNFLTAHILLPIYKRSRKRKNCVSLLQRPYGKGKRVASGGIDYVALHGRRSAARASQSPGLRVDPELRLP